MSITSGNSRRDPLAIVAWKWGEAPFQARHVNAVAAMFRKHLHIEHVFTCITDDSTGLGGDVFAFPMPKDYADTPRCRRRMQGFSRELSSELGSRILYTDLDIVIVDDITPIVDRREPIVGWKVGHAGVMSGSFLLADAGALDGAWRRFHAEPEAWPARLSNGCASDQAMVNDWLRAQTPVPYWTEADGFVSYYGTGYERLEHLGVGPNRQHLPAGARIVVLGSADIDVLNEGRFDWVREHYPAPVPA